MAQHPIDDTVAAELLVTSPSEGVTLSGQTGGGTVALGGRYEILSLLGSGGMGNVYKVRDQELDEVVALKVLKPELVGSPSALERFRREVKLARKVTHPGVARVFDIGEAGGEKLLTMEFVDGESLGGVLAREGRLSVNRALAIVRDVSAALEAAHAAGVVHRDLKPENVLVERGGRVVVTDFGIARATSAERQTQGLVGTPAYMAPEQLDGSELDGRADLYALGVMAYELLTGALPWQGDNLMAVVAMRLTQPPPDPRRVRPELPERVAALVVRCMARRPADRFADAGALRAAVGQTLDGLTEVGARGTLERPAPEKIWVQDTDKRVAVLPFRFGGPAEQEYVADGITEDVIDSLSAVPGLRVSSHGVVRKYRGADVDPREVGRALEAHVVVEGTLRRTSGGVRVSARLVSVADGVQLWSRRFDRPEAELLSLSDDTAQAIASALAVELRPAQTASTAPAAADLYLRARAVFDQQLAAVPETLDLFRRAMELAPDEPRIVAGYAVARARYAGADASTREASERAVRLAPDLADSHFALGTVAYHAGDEVGAVRALLTALRKARGHASSHDLLGRILSETELVEEAVRHLETALAVDPAMIRGQLSLARVLELAGRPGDAERVARAAGDGNAWPRLVLWRGDVAAMRALADELAGRSDTGSLVTQGVLRAALGDSTAPPISAIPRPRGQLPVRTQCFFLQMDAELAAFRGDHEGALDALERAAGLVLFDILWLERCPLFTTLAKEPRFVAVKAKARARADAVVAAYRAGVRG